MPTDGLHRASTSSWTSPALGLPGTSTYTEPDGTFELVQHPRRQLRTGGRIRPTRASTPCSSAAWRGAHLKLRLQRNEPSCGALLQLVSVAQMMVPESAEKLYRKATTAFEHGKYDKSKSCSTPLCKSIRSAPKRSPSRLRSKCRREICGGAAGPRERRCTSIPITATPTWSWAPSTTIRAGSTTPCASPQRSLTPVPKFVAGILRNGQGERSAKGCTKRGSTGRAGAAAQRQQLCRRSPDQGLRPAAHALLQGREVRTAGVPVARTE